jgi:atrophin-1 interacting protein 3 (BAI1-associated protein 1)
VIQAKREHELKKRIESGGSMSQDPLDIPLEPKTFFTKNPADLLGERIQTVLIKSQRGLGFTIVGGECNDDEEIDEFLQIKSIIPNSPAEIDAKLCTGDILVFVNNICVLGFTHHEMVNIFQSILPGEEVHLDVCRGYKLPFDPTDPNTEIVTTIAVNSLSDEMDKNRLLLDISHDNYNYLEMQNDQPGPSNGKSNFEVPEVHDIVIVKGDQGFGFTIAESNFENVVRIYKKVTFFSRSTTSILKISHTMMLFKFLKIAQLVKKQY